MPPPLNLTPDAPSDVESPPSTVSSPSQSPRSPGSQKRRSFGGLQLRSPEPEDDEEKEYGDPIIFKYEPAATEEPKAESPPVRKSSVPVIMVDDTDTKEEGPKKPKMQKVKRAGSPEKAAEPPPSPRGRRSSVCVAVDQPGQMPSELSALPSDSMVMVHGVAMKLEEANKMLEVRVRFVATSWFAPATRYPLPPLGAVGKTFARTRASLAYDAKVGMFLSRGPSKRSTDCAVFYPDATNSSN